MIPKDDPYGLEGRRRVVADYLSRYRKLKEAGRFDEAVEALRVATRLADESVDHTLRVARKILSRIETLCQEEAESRNNG